MPADVADAVHVQARYENPKNENSKSCMQDFQSVSGTNSFRMLMCEEPMHQPEPAGELRS